MTPLSRNSQKRFEHKQNQTKCGKMTKNLKVMLEFKYIEPGLLLSSKNYSKRLKIFTYRSIPYYADRMPRFIEVKNKHFFQRGQIQKQLEKGARDFFEPFSFSLF